MTVLVLDWIRHLVHGLQRRADGVRHWLYCGQSHRRKYQRQMLPEKALCPIPQGITLHPAGHPSGVMCGLPAHEPEQNEQ